MSDNFLQLVPADPEWQPDREAAERARSRLQALAPDADEVTAIFEEEISFFDPGSNLDRITCPACGADADPWWGDAMSAAAETGFSDRALVAPCCGARTGLDRLNYDWPAAFGRFALEAMNPGRGQLTPAERERIEACLGVPLREIWKRL